MDGNNNNVFIGEYCIVRSRDAGVFAGTIQHNKDGTVVLSDARRIWYWEGAASLSELSVRGTKKPSACKFPVPVPEVLLYGVCEVIPCSSDARESIESVPEWKA